MVRTLHGEDRSEAGVFTPIPRARLIERLAASASHPITLLLAPAGYGKSVIIRQYLATLSDTTVRFALRPGHASLLGFLRGLGEAIGDLAPHVGTTLAGAYERNTDSSDRGAQLAVWMHAHLESFDGVIAIDDLHLAEGDLEVARFISSLIERTKGKIRWILASRSTAGLPLGTWLAYRDTDLPIDEHELRFTFDEAREAANRLGLAIRDDELGELVALTEGWPAAMGFALRSSTRSSELRNISALTREMIYRLLAEQVYAGLDAEERGLLEVAVALPVIGIDVLERAGFDRALTIVERLRERTAFVHEESPGVYQCHDLFREFLRHQTALGGKRLQHEVHERAARALEESGDFEYAITSYVTAGLTGDVLRLLEKHGFDLLERARGDVVAHSIEVLDERTRRENAAILALQGILQSMAGKFSRAEPLLRRALSRAGNNRDLVARVSLRLASLMANQGRDVTDLLGAVGHDGEQHTSRRVEALSLIAGQRAVAGDHVTARRALAEVDALIDQIDSDAVRAKVLHHIGIAFHHLGMPGRAFDVLAQSTEIAGELHLYSIASRANAVLSNLALHEQDDVGLQLYYAEAAGVAAAKAGDAFAQQTALLQTLSARMRRGEVKESIEVEQRLATVRKSELAAQYLALFRSLRLAWEARFAEAQRLAASYWAALPNEFDKVVCGSQYALFLAINGERELSGRVVRKILALSATETISGLFRVRSIGIAKALCAIAEAINHRNTGAERILRGVKTDGDEVLAVITKSAETLVARLRLGSDGGIYRIHESLARLTELGYADVAALLAAVNRILSFGQFDTQEGSRLTATETDILRLLADGFIPKEIALRKDRSVYTVRVHIANAIAKLGCHGRAEAISIARRLKLI